MIERDPNGIGQHESGAKLDAGKIRPALVLGAFANALTEVVKVGTFGARKYTPNGWSHVDNGLERYTEAMMRHWLAEQSGEAVDDDSGMLHAAQVAWNALARLEFILRKPQTTYGEPPEPSITCHDCSSVGPFTWNAQHDGRYKCLACNNVFIDHTASRADYAKDKDFTLWETCPNSDGDSWERLNNPPSWHSTFLYRRRKVDIT